MASRMKFKSTFNIQEELARLSNPMPKIADPEDLAESATLPDNNQPETIAVGRSKLRKSLALETENEVRYQGIKTSRAKVDSFSDDNEAGDDVNNIMGSDQSDFNDDDEDDDDDSDGDDDEDYSLDEVNESDEDNFKMGSDVSQESSEENNDSEDESSSAEQDNNDDVELLSNKKSKGGSSDLVEKGRAVAVQLGLWDTMMDIRISVQKILLAVNCLPQSTDWASKLSHSDAECGDAIKHAQSGVKKLLDTMIQLQTALLWQNLETRSILTKKKDNSRKRPAAQDDDEEIASSEAEGEMNDDDESNISEETEKKLFKKIKMADYPQFLHQRHQDFTLYRNQTIQKWYDRTRITSTKLNKGFSAFEQSAVKQIEKILSDRSRLIRRTQTKRSAYQIIGKDVQSTEPVSYDKANETESVEANGIVASSTDSVDSEIFDDDDFYHHLLSEMLQKKVVDVNDPTALSRHWLELQKFRAKTKKKVDTKASKGRKLRYDVHSKLVNFMAPIDHCTWTDSQRNELFNSLFGQINGSPTLNAEIQQPT